MKKGGDGAQRTVGKYHFPSLGKASIICAFKECKLDYITPLYYILFKS